MEERMRQITFTKKQPPYNSGERAGFPELEAQAYVDLGNAFFSDDLEPLKDEAEISETNGTAEDVTAHDDDDRSAVDEELDEVDRESKGESGGDEKSDEEDESSDDEKSDEEEAPEQNKVHGMTVDEVGAFVAEVSTIEELQKYAEAELTNPDYENGRQGVFDHINERVAEIQDEDA